MTFKEFIHKKSTHIVIAIVAINIIVWSAWAIFKPEAKPRPKMVQMQDTSGPSEKRSFGKYEKSAKGVSEFRKLQREIDSLRIVAALEERIAREKAVKDSIAEAKANPQSPIQFVFDNWTAIFTIITAIPVIVLKWEQTIHKIKAMHKKVTS